MFSVEVVLGVAEVDFSVGFGGGLFWLGHGLRESLGGSVDRICELVSQVKLFVRICFWSIARFCLSSARVWYAICVGTPQ